MYLLSLCISIAMAGKPSINLLAVIENIIQPFMPSII